MKWILRVATSALFALPAFAANLNNPDAACNPALDPPGSNGCTWYNFYALPDGTIQSGSSFGGYYVAAPAPPWTITTTSAAVIRVVDGGHQGDVFDVYDNGTLLGETSATTIDTNHSCANDSTGAGTDPAACWNDPLMSKGTFALPAGNHSLTVVWKQQVPGGMSSLQWFEVGAATNSGGSLTFVGSMPHIATEGDWTTTFTLVNKGSTSSETMLSAYADSGLPLTLPLDLVQTSTNLLVPSIDQTLAANASLIAVSSGSPQVPVLTGGAQVQSAGTVDGFAIFHINSTSQEAVVPLETRNASSYLLAFDNTSGVATGVALENISTQAANVNVIIRNDAGTQIGTGNVSLPASGHTSFVLATQFPFTANLRGTAEFDTPTGGQISALGIRYTPAGTITTLPMLTGAGAAGGSIAHIAVQGGFTTTFVLVNTGTGAASATLNFFGDSGSPLPVALTFPQTGTTTAATSSTTQSLGPGATFIVQNTNSSTGAVQTGSAQLTTNGSVTGFVIFHFGPNSQEAVVPLENRNASSYIVAFDNTSNTSTGVAVNNASSAAISIPVVIRNDSGAQIGTGTVPLAANGHNSFVLATQYPATANIRGTIEFDKPNGATIGVVGIRVPQAVTLTTLPALAH